MLSSVAPAAKGIVLVMKHKHHITPVPSTVRAFPHPLRYRALVLACVGGLGLLGAACGGDDRPVADAGDSFCSQLSDSSNLADSLGDPATDGQRVADAFQ
ncbi:MAG TPA: hypothetical protein VLD86_16200, partial [Ilumatobacteraceae bacterium]|nr:hypothetical protein [Ilumatobacteraceae bacterium]